MTFLEGMIMTSILLCCTGGIGWLLYDMDKQLKTYKDAYKAHQESTLGLVEDDDEE